MKRNCLSTGPLGTRCYRVLETLWERRGPAQFVLLGWTISRQSPTALDRVVKANNKVVFFVFYEHTRVMIVAAKNYDEERTYEFTDDCDEEDPPVPQWILQSLDELSPAIKN